MTALAQPATVRPSLLERARQRVAEPFEAFASIWRNRALRRLEYAWVGSIIGTWAYAIALGVYAYHVGGAAAVGIAGLIRTLPTIMFGAFAASLGDRYRRVRVMVCSDLVRAVLFGAGAACIALEGPAAAVYIVGGLIMLAGSPFRPAQAALLPVLTQTPEQLTAMNVVSSTIESVGFFAGPALGGILLAATNAETVFAASAVTCVWSALMLTGLAPMVAAAQEESDKPAPPAPGGFFRESVQGFSTIFSDKKLRTLVSLFTAQTLVAGALNVFVVVLALRLYESGPTGVGTLNAALGVGGIIGAGAAAALVGGRRLARGFAFGLIFWGAPLLLIGGVDAEIVGLIGLAAIGLANTVIDVSGFTLLQRAVPDEVLARVFGVLETVLIAGIGLGALATPAIIDALGVRGALFAVGGFLPLLTFMTWAKLRVLDAGASVPEERIELLKSIPLFRPLPLATIEFLAAQLEEREVEPEEPIIRIGQEGDRFYVIGEGRFRVLVGDGEAGVVLGPGDFFGEIALLKNVPRTATVTTMDEPGVLYSLTREDFVPAVTGSATSTAAADEVVGARIARLSRPGALRLS